MITPEISNSVKDEDTVVSETSNEELEPVVLVDSEKESRKNYMIGGCLLVAVVAGIAFFVARMDCEHDSEPAFQQQEPPVSLYDYELADSFSPVTVASLFYKVEGAWAQLGFIDDTGCVDIVNYSLFGEEQAKAYQPLCNGYTQDVHSLDIGELFSVVSHGDSVEVWRADYDSDSEGRTWIEVPTAGANIITMPNVPGFGKKIECLTGDRIIIASDEAVHQFELSKPADSEAAWVEAKRWEGANGFDVDPEHTNLAIYTTKEITVYDLSAVDWHAESYEPAVHISPKEITSLAVSMHGTRIHVVTDHGYNIMTVVSLLSDNMKGFNTPTKLVGDIIYSVNSGCLFDARTGSYLSIEVKGFDDIFNVQVSGDRISVLLERDGVKMVDVYEK